MIIQQKKKTLRERERGILHTNLQKENQGHQQKL